MTWNQKLWNEYAEFSGYIASPEWRLLKQARFKLDGNMCILCKTTEHLVCHHLTYERLYNENLNDLIILCTRCHSRIHRICPPKKQPDFTKSNIMSEITKPTTEECLKVYEELF